MLKDSKMFSGFSVNDLGQAKEFYGQILGLSVTDGPMGLEVNYDGDMRIFIYQKNNHAPATYTVLNFEVDDIDTTVDALTANGIVFEQYENMTDNKGITRGIAANRGPDIAWFKDPAGNILSVLQSA